MELNPIPVPLMVPKSRDWMRLLQLIPEPHLRTALAEFDTSALQHLGALLEGALKRWVERARARGRGSGVDHGVVSHPDDVTKIGENLARLVIEAVDRRDQRVKKYDMGQSGLLFDLSPPLDFVDFPDFVSLPPMISVEVQVIDASHERGRAAEPAPAVGYAIEDVEALLHSGRPKVLPEDLTMALKSLCPLWPIC
jgi:hypothetical protein